MNGWGLNLLHRVSFGAPWALQCSPRGKVNEHFSIVSGDFTLHDDSYGYFAVENASNDREILTDKRNLAQETKFGNILMVL